MGSFFIPCQCSVKKDEYRPQATDYRASGGGKWSPDVAPRIYIYIEAREKGMLQGHGLLPTSYRLQKEQATRLQATKHKLQATKHKARGRLNGIQETNGKTCWNIIWQA